MDEESKYLKLPVIDQCVHELWKARVNGYVESKKLFLTIDDEKSPEFSKYAPLMKKFVCDSNAMAQEKGLEAALVFIENAQIATKTAGDVVSGIVAKCMNSPKRNTVDKALEVILMYCEIEKHEIVQEELIKGFSQKNPKVVCNCVKAVSMALREFGNKVISVKSLVKSMGPLLEDRDKNVREEAKKMVIEMYRWVGTALKPQLTSLKPIQIQELESEFEKISQEKPSPTRYLRSQQIRTAKSAGEGEANCDDENDEDNEEADEIDPLDLMAPVNILDQIPKDFYEKVESAKWQERKEAINSVLPLTQNPKLEPGDYGDIVKVLKKIIAKDTNVMIIALAVQCLCGIAKGLKKRFSPYSLSCMETVLEKFKEKKLNVVTALREAVDAIYFSTNIETIQELVCNSLKNKNPSVKAETASFLARAFCYCTPDILNKKLTKVYSTSLLLTLNESDPHVRDSSAEALGALMKVAGEKTITPFLSDVDSLKMQKIKESFEKAEVKVKIKSSSKSKSTSATVNDSSESKVKSIRGGGGGRPKTINGKMKKDAPSRTKSKNMQNGINKEQSDERFDNESDFGVDSRKEESTSHSSNISELITDNLISELKDRDWKVRLEALDKVNSILNGKQKISPDVGELPSALALRISDMNKNIATKALTVTSQLASALGSNGRCHSSIIVPGIFSALGDSKKVIREAALLTLNDWVENLGSLRDVVDNEIFITALKSGTPFLKIEVIQWMSEKLNEAPPKSLNKEELVGCVEFIFSGLEDRNVDIRKVSAEAIFPFMLHLGFDCMSKLTSKVKPASRNTVTQSLEKAKVNLPASAIAKSVSDNPSTKPKSAGLHPSGTKKIAVKSKVAARSRVVSAPVPSRDEDEDRGPLLQVNQLKQQRALDEHRLRTLRWEFTIPRQDFILQLKDQMIKASIEPNLMTKMFHVDFKFHIQAIDALTDDLNTNLEACIANLDLILRWLTIRFFDTNPSVILRSMDYLNASFTLLNEQSYTMLDYEAKAFLPFLVMKLGDPKESIRTHTKDIINKICHMYAASKVFPYIINGVNVKNARQRAECLEVIGSLIEGFGMLVCQPTPAAALKDVVKQIADRDNSVRNAALNCLLQVYYKQGDKLYKLIGNISDKDRSLLDERIKRSDRNRPVINKSIQALNDGKPEGVSSNFPNRIIPTPASMPAPPLRNSGIPSKRTNTKSDQESNIRLSAYMDCERIEKLLNSEDPHVNEYSDFTLSPYLTECLQRQEESASVINENIANANVDSEDSSQAILAVVSQVTSNDVDIVISAISQLSVVIRSKEHQASITPHVDQLLVVVSFQLRHVLDTMISGIKASPVDTVKILKCITSCLMDMLNVHSLASKASTVVLQDLIRVCIDVLLDSRLASLDDSSRIVRSMNVLVLRFIEKTDFTSVFSALLKLLHEAVKNSVNTKYVELVMKCNWQAIRRLRVSSKEDLNPVQILVLANDFMKAFPSNSWAKRPSDAPLHTIKLVLRTLVKIYREEILTHMANVPNGKESECERYLIKDLNRSSGLEDKNHEKPNALASINNTETLQTPNKNRKLSKQETDALCEIFSKIGNKESTKEGLRQLYEFKRSHPDADINSCLRNSSQRLQNYIERGLKRVEMEESKEPSISSTSTNVVGSSSNEVTSFSSIHDLVDEFKEFATRAGFDNPYIESAIKDICTDNQNKYSSGFSKTGNINDEGEKENKNISSTPSASGSGTSIGDLVDQFRDTAAKAGFDKHYIDSAVEDICGKDREIK